MSTIVQTLTNQSLIGNLLLLLVTAILTGLLVPIIKTRIDNKSFQRQKLFEADLARQAKVIEYETKLLDDIHKSLWEYRTLVKHPALYKKIGDEERYQKAVQKYDEKADDLFSEIRAQVGMTQRLASPKVYQEFRRLYDDLKKKVHAKHLELVQKSASSDSASHIEELWNRQYDVLYEDLANRIDQVLYQLAEDFHLIERKDSPNTPALSENNSNTSSAPAEKQGEELADLSPSR